LADSFTTWSDLLDQLLDDLASGQVMVKSYMKGNVQVNYRDLDELRRCIEWVREEAAIEAGTSYARTYLQPMGRYDG
jgi:hypothetical protein